MNTFFLRVYFLPCFIMFLLHFLFIQKNREKSAVALLYVIVQYTPWNNNKNNEGFITEAYVCGTDLL
jgi:hypothetical protein